MKGEVDILANFPIDTSQKKKAHSALEIRWIFSIQAQQSQSYLDDKKSDLPNQFNINMADKEMSPIRILSLIVNITEKFHCREVDHWGHGDGQAMMMMSLAMKVNVMTVSPGCCGQWSRALGWCTTLKTRTRSMQSVVRWGAHELINTTMLWPYSHWGAGHLATHRGLIGPF